MGILGYLTLAFVFCKLAGLTAIATWSWVWVISPLWVGVVVALPIAVLLASAQIQLQPARSTTVHWVSGGYETQSELPPAPAICKPATKEPGAKYNRVNARPWGHSAKRKCGKRTPTLSANPSCLTCKDSGFTLQRLSEVTRVMRPCQECACPWPDMRHL